MDLIILEKELKKIWSLGYRWGRKQNNNEDKMTNFIYSCRSFSSLNEKLKNLSDELKDYAINRWYNFWSAQGVEYIFAQHINVEQNLNSYDKLVDFSISGKTFDHKTTVFPKNFGNTYSYAKTHKKELIEWLYKNQSQQGRMHLENRLFICLYDSGGQEHWKMKAEIGLLKRKIDEYIQGYDSGKLVVLNFGNNDVYSDIIWIEK